MSSYHLYRASDAGRRVRRSSSRSRHCYCPDPAGCAVGRLLHGRISVVAGDEPGCHLDRHNGVHALPVAVATLLTFGVLFAAHGRE